MLENINSLTLNSRLTDGAGRGSFITVVMATALTEMTHERTQYRCVFEILTVLPL